MWTPDHRRAADRRGLRYPSNLTDGGDVLRNFPSSDAPGSGSPPFRLPPPLPRPGSRCRHELSPRLGVRFGSELRCDLLPPSAMVFEIFMKPFFNQG